jgi:hypothetical protein
MFASDLDWNQIAWGLGLAVATFVGSLAMVTIVIVLLPATYFSWAPGWWGDRYPLIRWTVLVLKNLLGAAIVAVGIAMLFLPGQGILTILIGLLLLNFPGKRRLLLLLLRRPGVLDSINRLRARFHKPPLVVEEHQR